MRACLGWWLALTAVAFAFLSSLYVMAGVRIDGNPHQLTISGAVAHSDATYGTSLALVVVLVGLLLALEATCRIPLARASVPVAALAGFAMLLSIAITWKRHRPAHYAFTALALVGMVVLAGLWTHAAWPDRTARVLLPTLTVLLALAGVGVGVAGRRRQMRCVATMEWLAIGLFLSAALCSCSGRPACHLGREPTGA